MFQIGDKVRVCSFTPIVDGQPTTETGDFEGIVTGLHEGGCHVTEYESDGETIKRTMTPPMNKVEILS